MASGRDHRNLSPSHSGTSTLPRTSRSRPAVLNGMGSSIEDKNNDFLCPICFNLIEEAYITKCGHTFCYSCICKSIEIHRRCPKCGCSLAGQDQIFPNFLLNELISKYKMKLSIESLGQSGSVTGDSVSMNSSDGLRSFITAESQNLSMPDVNVMLEILTQRKQLLEAESCAAQNRLLYDFLKHLYQMKEEHKNQLIREVALIKKDMEEVAGILKDVQSKCPTLEDIVKTDSSNPNVAVIRQEIVDLIDTIDANMLHRTGSIVDRSTESGVDSSFGIGQKVDHSTLAAKKRRMHAHFDDFVQCYFNCRSKDLYFGADEEFSNQDTLPDQTVTQADSEGVLNEKPSSGDQQLPQISTCSGLDVFRENLVKFSRFKGLRPLATLSYSSDVINYSTIVSTIEFDKDNEFFAIAGVTKRIKVFDYNCVVRDMVDIHYPCVEMTSSHKISCVSWNTYHKGILASSDYEGTVTVWDVATGQKTKTFQEHDKRCWSVNFNAVDVRLIASGSDDARVKLWSLNVDHSIATLEAKFNVCCVRFNPKSSCHLAFGSADHCVHYYDLRNMKEPLSIFKDHRKAVSYVTFLNSEDIVSASTDSQLKIWNINSPRCLRSFVGHINEKNFVGLATNGDYVACGSENNALYVYYKGLTKQLFSYKFDTVRSFLDQDKKDDEQNEFVSAVCWRQNTNVVVAANSQGTIKVLELI